MNDFDLLTVRRPPADLERSAPSSSPPDRVHAHIEPVHRCPCLTGGPSHADSHTHSRHNSALIAVVVYPASPLGCRGDGVVGEDGGDGGGGGEGVGVEDPGAGRGAVDEQRQLPAKLVRGGGGRFAGVVGEPRGDGFLVVACVLGCGVLGVVEFDGGGDVGAQGGGGGDVEGGEGPFAGREVGAVEHAGQNGGVEPAQVLGDEFVLAGEVLVGRLHPVSMACDYHLTVLAIQAWGGGRGTDVDVQRLCLVSWKPRSTAWRTQARSHHTSAGCGQDAGANAQVRPRSIRGRPLGNASSCS